MSKYSSNKILKKLTCKIDHAMANVIATPVTCLPLDRIDKNQMCIWNLLMLTQKSSVEQRC